MLKTDFTAPSLWGLTDCDYSDTDIRDNYFDNSDSDTSVDYFDISDSDKNDNHYDDRDIERFINANFNTTASGFSNDIYISKKQRWFNKYDFVTFIVLKTNSPDTATMIILGVIYTFRTDNIVNNNRSYFRKTTIYSFKELSTYLNSLEGNNLIYLDDFNIHFHEPFDVCSIFENKLIKPLRINENDGTIYSITFSTQCKKINKTFEIKIVNYSRMVGLSLCNFNNYIILGQFYYYNIDYYESYNNKTLTSVDNYIKELKDKEKAEESIKSVGLNPLSFDPLEYLEKCCIFECKSLINGLLEFKECFNTIFQDLLELNPIVMPIRARIFNLKPTLELFDYLTLSSISHEILVHLNCFEEVYPLRLDNRVFVTRALNYFGHITNSKLHSISPNLEQVMLKAINLIPSAIIRCFGIPKGHGKIATDINEMTQLIEKSQHEQIYFVIECKIINLNVTHKFSLPSINYRNRYYYPSKDLIGKELYIDSITLLDYKTMYNIEVKPLSMIYWTDFNTKVIDVIKSMFNLKNKYRRENNKILEHSINMIMHHCIIRSLIKPNYGEYVFNPVEHPIVQPSILESHESRDKGGKIIAKCIKIKRDISSHKNFAHFGTMVFSMSHRIMNEVIYVDSDNAIIKQKYDTFHLLKYKFEKLEERYFEVYNKRLIGSDLTQFQFI